jgi:hypothetical protein
MGAIALHPSADVVNEYDYVACRLQFGCSFVVHAHPIGCGETRATWNKQDRLVSTVSCWQQSSECLICRRHRL